MPIVKCSSCGVSLKVPETAIGKKVKCRCGEVVSVPAATTAEQALPTAPSKSSPAKPSPKIPASTPNFFDQLTSKDLERRDAPKEVKTDTHQKKSSDALAPYMKSEGKPGRRAVSDTERWDNIDAIYTVFFALALLEAGGVVFSFFQMILGGSVLSVKGMIFFTFFSLVPISLKVATGFGLLRRKTWGWWLAIILLGMVAGFMFPLVRGLVSLLIAAIRFGLDWSVATSALAYGGFGVVISLIAIWMMRQLIHPGVMKRFNIAIPPILGWVIGIFGGYSFGLLYSFILFRVILNAVW